MSVATLILVVVLVLLLIASVGGLPIWSGNKAWTPAIPSLVGLLLAIVVVVLLLRGVVD